MFATPPTVMSFIKSGDLKAIALTPAKPSAAIPGVAGAEESGLSGYNSTFSYGLYFPAGTPAAIPTRCLLLRPRGWLSQGSSSV
jgi:tripartite-type tricarboxylate transporter receptor subunit TctC